MPQHLHVRLTALAILGATLGALAPARALTPDDENVWGLVRLRTEVVRALRDGETGEVGPWTLRYTGPHERGTVVWVTMQPDQAFETKRVDRDEFQVRLKDPKRLLTKVTGDLRPIGVKILKTLEEPGEGRVYVTYQNKVGEDLDLEKLQKLKMIVDLKWSVPGAAEFLGYQGPEAGFRRRPGHEDTSIEVLCTVREEGHDYVYSAWLPRLGDTVAVAPRQCRDERVFTGRSTVSLKTPWVKVTRQGNPGGARANAHSKVWEEMLAHCEGRLGGELIQDTVRIDYDCQNRDSCIPTRSCQCAASASYQCQIRQYQTVEICN